MWLVDYQVLSANPADPRDWEKLDAFLRNRYRQLHHGGDLAVEACAVDTGGHFTHQVYAFCRERAYRRVYAVAGSSRYGGPIKGPGRKQDVNWRGQVIKGGVTRWEIGTDTAKDLLYGRLRITQPGAGCVHFPKGLPHEFYEQLTAEGRVLQRTATGEQYRWVKRRLRNEVLDATVYALWCVQMLDLHRYTERMWDRLEAAVQPPPDLFSARPLDREESPVVETQEAVTVIADAPARPTERPTPVRRPFARAW
jgi:phage terminase large subunit GpA-like protein